MCAAVLARGDGVGDGAVGLGVTGADPGAGDGLLCAGEATLTASAGFVASDVGAEQKLRF